MSPKYDLVVFGGSGVTGQRVIAEVASASQEEQPPRTFAVAGRSEAKLRAVLQRLRINADVLVADVSDDESLQAMARSARVVLDCVGPFRYFGEPVVAACVAAGTHYLDICGEPDFMERMEFKFDAKAREAGCCVVSGAGFDSVPADVGCLWTQRKFAPAGLPASVESYVTMHCQRRLQVNFGTWESLVAGVANADGLRRLRKEVRSAGTRPPPPKTPGPKLTVSNKAVYKPMLGAYALPFPGADASVVKRTQAVLAARKEPATQYAAYLTVKSYWSVLLMYFFGAIVQQLCTRPWGRKLLLRYPGLFSNGIFTKGELSEEDLNTTTFSMTFVARGYSDAATAATSQPDREITTRITGAEPAYRGTAIMLVQSALFLLTEGPRVVPGVHTPAAALGSDAIVDRLSKHHIKFELLSDRQL